MPSQSSELEQSFYLEPIPGVPYDPTKKYNFMALVIVGYSDGEEVKRDSPILDFINNLYPNEYKKIMISMQFIANYGKRCPGNHFVSDAKGRYIYEIRPSHGISRLYCFPDKNDRILICCNSHIKSMGGPKAQKREFDNCFAIKKLYYKYEYNEIL